MFKGLFKKGIFALVLGIVLGVSVSAVLATTTYSPWKYYGPVYGYYYQNQSSCSNDNGYVKGFVESRNSSGYNVPAGYMGMQPMLYKNDVLLFSEDMYYTPIDCIAMRIGTMYTYDSGTFYAKGYTAAYTGNGYYTYSVYQSPSLNN